MKYNKLGQTDLVVSELCLGTMTWGTQNSADDAFYQIEKSIDAGINFIDTAELYPVNPISGVTQGESERILGEWLSRSNVRDELIIATKIAGNGPKHIRNGEGITNKSLFTAINASLKLLKTDVDKYLDSDPELAKYKQKVDYIQTVVDFLDRTIKQISNRGFQIKNAIDWRKFTSGAI